MSFSAKNGHISHLGLKTERKLYKKLDIRKVAGEDYRSFASHVGTSSDDLALTSQTPNPTEEILQWWKCKPDATISELIRVLVEMGRQDCVEIVKEDPLFDECKDVKDTIQKYVEVSHEEDKCWRALPSLTRRDVIPNSLKPRRALLDSRKAWLAQYADLVRLGDLKDSTYNKLCDELNGTLNYQPNPPSTFSSLAEEMGYNMGKIREFKNSTNPTDALLQDWGKRPGNGVNELIKLLKKVERKALAEMLEKEVEEILERENLDVKPKRKADPTGKEGPEKKRKRKRKRKRKAR